MGSIEKEGEEIVYRQDDGEITAWLTNFKEEMELSYEGNPIYKKPFYIAVLIASLYLCLIFVLF
jgi:hypothetical protein